MTTQIDPYEVLEISRRASGEVVNAAYFALVRKFDQRKSPIPFEFIAQAHQILSDPAQKAAYDEQWKDLVGKIVGQRYRVIKRIGQGDFYYDYMGEHVISQLPVLIRQCSELSPQKEEVLLKEARALWDLRHHGLPAIRDIFRLEDGSLAIVMSYVEGKTLEEKVEELGPLHPETVAWIAQRSLNTLWYMHERGQIHKGINPRNVIIQDNHLVILANLSQCLVTSIQDEACRNFSRIFAPPEEESGLPLVPESDFYSLGLTMIYGMSGETRQVERRRVPDNVPEPFKRFIRSLIVQEVAARPNWETSNPFEEIQRVRMESFGRLHSEMRPLAAGQTKEKNGGS